MEKSKFIEFLQENILTLFTGSEIFGEEPSSVRDTLVVQGAGGSIQVKFEKTDDYRIIIKRIQPFKAFEISLVRFIVAEMKSVLSFGNVSREYLKKFEQFAIEKAICSAVSSSNSKLLFELIDRMSKWGSRTYEGKRPELGFVISSGKAAKNTNTNLHIFEMLDNDFSAVLSDGKNTCLELTSDGYLIQYLNATQKRDQNLYAPYGFLKMAGMATGTKVAIVLQANGDILLFKNKMLVFAKKRGKWISFSHEEIINLLAERGQTSVEEIRKSIYISSLDTSFAGTGGCIVHLSREEDSSVLKHINKYDILIEDYYIKKVNEDISQSFFSEIREEAEVKSFYEFLKEERCVKIAGLRKIINNKKFHELDRKLRQELIAIDGATIIDTEGNIIAIGAIIQIEAGSTGGGRLAATKTLSKYGVAVKISADGTIQGFRMDKQKLRARPLFMI